MRTSWTRPAEVYSGNIMLRIDPVLHAQAAAVAKGKSLNAWAQEILQQVVAGV